MSNLARTTRHASSRSKVLLVRQPVKSVRPSEAGDTRPFKLSVGIVATLGGLGVIWLIGYLGFELGFAPLLKVPQLENNPTGALATGTLMLLRVPNTILAAGLAGPEWLIVAFAMVAIPAAGLSAAKPRRPGGPTPPTVVVVFGIIGAVAAGINAVVLVWWIASPPRGALLSKLPGSPADVSQWDDSLQVVAGLDVLGVVVAGLWVILIMRLPLYPWLRALTMTTTIFALAVTIVGMSMSSAIAALIHTPRSVCLHEDVPSLHGQLLVGSTRHRHAMLQVEGSVNLIELVSDDQPLTVLDTQTIVEFLESANSQRPQ